MLVLELDKDDLDIKRKILSLLMWFCCVIFILCQLESLFKSCLVVFLKLYNVLL